ncbi:MAG: aminotransferase class IV [Deltaproteobacteria bacterium]|nr:aminotransferase class IV [Deltaproteobacteria bacterium]
MNKVSINGRLYPADKAGIPIFDRAYLYGAGAFETLRAYNGTPAFVDLHHARLRDNCAALQIPFRSSLTAFRAQLLAVLRENHARNVALRVTASQVGTTAIRRPRRGRSMITIFLRPLPRRTSALYRRGACVILVQDVHADPPSIGTIKSTSYLSKVLARNEVAAAHADEGLFMTSRDEIVEGTFTNLFVVHRGRVITPPLATGVLPGVTRYLVLFLAQSLGLPVVEQRLHPADLRRADELFLTGTTTEILPIREVRGLVRRRPGPVTHQLMEAYQQLVQFQVQAKGSPG